MNTTKITMPVNAHKLSPPPNAVTKLSAPTRSSVLSRPSRWHRRLLWLTALHLAGVAALWYLIWEISESHWLGSVVTFLPRLPWLLPGAVLILWSLAVRSHALWWNALTTGFVLLAIAEFNVPWQRLQNSEAGAGQNSLSVRVASCNVQNFAPDFSLVLQELQQAKPDVIALQEAFRPPEVLLKQYPDWHRLRVRGFWIAARWPLRLLGECQTDVFSHLSAIAVEVASPNQPFVVVDVHLMTARKSLIELSPLEVVSGDAQAPFMDATMRRMIEARQVREFLDQYRSDLPLVVVGDFNMPTSSSLYRAQFAEFQNCFESASWGFGFTAPCKRFRWWPRNTPWQRIDHILASHDWHIVSCHVGNQDGSDHRMIAATLQSRNSPDTNKSDESKNSVPDLSAEVDRLR
jgi:endonuclease/exonuclease/phosphatase family metal-dependent hydrolase